MPELPPQLTPHLKALRELASRSGVRSVAVVGSAACGGFDADRSDVDLLVDFGPYSADLGRRVTGFVAEAERLLGRRVDVISVHGVRSTRWREILESTSVPIYAAA